MILIATDIHLKRNDQFGKDIDIGVGPINTRSVIKIGEIKKIIEKEKADTLIIAGDLFHTPNPPEPLRLAFFDLSKIADIIVLSGNHDPKHRIPAGYSEANFIRNVKMIPVGGWHAFNDLALVSYTRDREIFEKNCTLAKEKGAHFLISHMDYTLPWLQELGFEAQFHGHTHEHGQIDTVYSIGSLFKDSWAEENHHNYYLMYDQGQFQFRQYEDLKLKTVVIEKNYDNPSPSFISSFDAVRFHYKGDASYINSIDEKGIKKYYDPTPIFFKWEVDKSEIRMTTENIDDAFKEFLASKQLTEEEREFGMEYLR